MHILETLHLSDQESAESQFSCNWFRPHRQHRQGNRIKIREPASTVSQDRVTVPDRFDGSPLEAKTPFSDDQTGPKIKCDCPCIIDIASERWNHGGPQVGSLASEHVSQLERRLLRRGLRGARLRRRQARTVEGPRVSVQLTEALSSNPSIPRMGPCDNFRILSDNPVARDAQIHRNRYCEGPSRRCRP